MQSERAQAMWEECAGVVWYWSHGTARSHQTQSGLSRQPDDRRQCVVFALFYHSQLQV